MAVDEIAHTTLATTLIVPGDERQSLAHAKTSDADAVVLDLAIGDGVARAREQVLDVLEADGWGDAMRLVRVNAWSSAHTYRDVIEVAETVGGQLDALVLPGVQTAHDVAALDLLLTQIEVTMGLVAGGIGVVAQLDDARGVQAATAITAVARVRALACNVCEFGTAVRLAARAAGLPAYCLAGDAAHVSQAADDGFDGVWVDDPALVATAAAAFA